MSKSSGMSKSMAGWTMVDSKGEVMSEDNLSESSDSSAEIVGIRQDNSTRVWTSGKSQPEQEERLEQVKQENIPSVSITSGEEEYDQAPYGEGTHQPLDNETAFGICHSSLESFVERDGGLGACCTALLGTEGIDQTCPSKESRGLEEKEEVHHGTASGISVNAGDDQLTENVLDDGVRDPQEKSSSDSDSDFVQINEDNIDELEAEIARSRNVSPNRSPSIAEEFNFLAPQGIAIIDRLPERFSDEERDYEYEDFNEDTESSTEEIGDDRIESDQSEVGSVNTLTDVGDLSAFADIGDLPLVVGNVARNYRHRPNNRLSTALNVVLVLVTMLTMGISIGLIMATDLEIEEWQSAYLVQVKKVDSLEWTLGDMNQALKDSKDKVDAYESVLKSFSKAAAQNSNSIKFFKSFAGIVNSFDSCTKKVGSLSTVNCHAQILPDIQQTLSIFKGTKQFCNENDSSYSKFEQNVQQKLEEPKTLPSEKQACDAEEMKESLHREQERALHWQNLYLLERRQREWERENDNLEDKRERAQWEKEDEEEDRKEREKWEQEEAENDRKERLMWEKEDEEEDRREREKWEKERAELDSLECLKKLMSTNLTILKSQVLKWNVTAFDDFVNMSSLSSSILELKHSVLVSVQQIWAEAEEAITKMGEDLRSGRQSYLDTSVMADYLKQALSVLQSQFDDVVNPDADHFTKKEQHQDKNFGGKSNMNDKTGAVNNKDFKKDQDKEEQSSMWNKTIGKIFKKTSKSLRKFVRSVATSWIQVKDLWEKRASNLLHSGKTAKKETSNPIPALLSGKMCLSVLKQKARYEDILVESASPCLWEVRDGWSELILNQPCLPHNRYSLACNVDHNTVWQLKRDLRKVLDMSGRLHSVKVGSKERKNMLDLFEDFWKMWGDSELLLQTDKDWAICQLKFWSDFRTKGPNVRPTDVKNGCCVKLVNLKTVLNEIESWKTQHKDRSEKNDEETHRERSEEEENEEEDKAEEDHPSETLNVFHKSNLENGLKNDIRREDSATGSKTKVFDESHEKSSYASHPNKQYEEMVEEGNSTNFDYQMSDNDYYEQMGWYLKRAQHRIEIRRAQEKEMWFFDMYNHREDMRKEKNTRKKSAQWLFDQAEDREFQRKKARESDWLFDQAKDREFQRKKDRESDWLFDQAEDRKVQRKKAQEADWLFDRAHHRREDFSKKWRQKSHEFKKWEDQESLRRRQKMKDLSESEWLLQNEGNRIDSRRKKEKNRGKVKKEDFRGTHEKSHYNQRRNNSKNKKQQSNSRTNKKAEQEHHKKGQAFRQPHGKKAPK